MNYEGLIKALRCKRDDCEGCGLAFFDKDEGWMCQYAAKDDDAAAAIEALNRLLDQNTQRCEALRKQLREAHESYERHLNELEAQLPKRGEFEKQLHSMFDHVWDCEIDHPMFQDTVGELMEAVLQAFDDCVADMRKMEVQDDKA